VSYLGWRWRLRCGWRFIVTTAGPAAPKEVGGRLGRGTVPLPPWTDAKPPLPLYPCTSPSFPTLLRPPSLDPNSTPPPAPDPHFQRTRSPPHLPTNTGATGRPVRQVGKRRTEQERSTLTKTQRHRGDIDGLGKETESGRGWRGKATAAGMRRWGGARGFAGVAGMTTAPRREKPVTSDCARPGLMNGATG
jgi:hypothetical protein